LEAALSGAQVILGAMPSAHARAIYASALPFAASGASFVSASKGLEPSTHLRMSEVIAQIVSSEICAAPRRDFPDHRFAMEAARGETYGRRSGLAGCRACRRAAGRVRRAGVPSLYQRGRSGVELAGAMKNVMAIAAGACQGLGFGSNILAALITRGLAEMARLAVALGARPETLSGLAGLGDLVLTCTGSLSRNRFVESNSAKDVLWAKSSKICAWLRGREYRRAVAWRWPANIESKWPITEQVDAILHASKFSQRCYSGHLWSGL